MTQPASEPTAAVSLVPPTFLPWLRTGLAAHLDAPAVGGLAPAGTATISVAVQAHATGPDADTTRAVTGPAVRLTAPGEVVGLDPRQVVRTDPEPGAADAEPNYFAQVELAAPDLPWRFTPASAVGGRLQPWLALVVVEDRDGVTLEPAGGGRLAVLRVDDAERELPDLTGCWAWAHVHADADLLGEGATDVATLLADAPELLRARLLCPRRLTPKTSWIACVVPTFASGRQAGLGEPVTASGLAWTLPAAGEVRLPVYYSWRFSTGPRGDFESLVRRLRPRELPGSVGRRDLDVRDPGGGLPTAPGLLLTYEGALLSPAGRPRPWPAEHRTALKAALRRAVNRRLSAPATPPTPYDALRHDPVVGPPAYAAAPAGRRAVPADGRPPVWFEQLNTEPPHRVVAGLGAEVVRADQEALMAAAWKHAARLRAVNHLLRRARLAWEVGTKLRPKVLALDDARILQLAGPALARLPHPTSGTARGAMAASALPDGLVSGAFQRVTRTVRGFTRTGPAGERLPATAAVTAAAVAAPAAFTAAWQTRTVTPGTELDGPLPDLGALVPGAAGRAAQSLTRRPAPPRAVRAAAPADPGPGRLDQDPVGVPDQTGPGPVGVGVVDLAGHVRAGLDPAGTVTVMVQSRVVGLPRDRDHDVPPRWRASPDFTTPMSERLIARSVEYLVPGIGQIPDDTLGLLEVNRPFVEAFLAGFNHELGREFLWREYPAGLGATWARQFWDTGPGGAADVIRIHTWLPATALGEHQPEEAASASLVLLLKGALPRRYPDLRVYAVEAEWTADGRRREKAGGEVKPPLLTGRLEADTCFWGFELTAPQARGSTDPDAHLPGWFFVLEQKPGATRFGLDGPRPGLRGKPPRRWSDLSWSHLAPEGEGPLPAFASPDGPQWLEDAGALAGNGGRDTWGQDAAAMARITLQRPVRMLVHADAMLPPGPSPPPGWQPPDFDLDPLDLPGHGGPDLPGKGRPSPPGGRAGGRGPRRGRSGRGAR